MISLKDALIFVGGVAVGLYVAKLYARNKVDSTIQGAFNAIGLPQLAPTVEGLVTPQVVG
jgi:hypothetical protein